MNIDLNILIEKNVTSDQYILLHLLYYKDFETILKLYGKNGAIILRDSLLFSPYILEKGNKFTETIISKKNVEELLGIKSEKINFWEFYNCYPVKYGTRILRASGPNTQLAQKHEKKYLSKIKTLSQHKKAVEAIEAFVSKKKQKNELMFLPGIEVVINNSLWEQWNIFVEDKGLEGKEWDTDLI